ncbi:MAG: serine/threonine protein kinase [Proteobacteria bacterium]|nr:serine/threonine protein kinase [Pseudomonadota bacterium]
MREHENLQASAPKLLKKDIFGRTDLLVIETRLIIRRDARPARVAVRFIARKMLEREARTLALLEGTTGVPDLIRVDRDTLDRTYIEGQPMQDGRPADPRYFKAAAKILRHLHRQNVAHNDLAKEPNFLVTSGRQPAIIDFQLAWFAPRRGALFRIMAREDIRHLLKHKRTYCPQHLTRREVEILNHPSWLARIWMRTAKPVYLFITRRLLKWQDREGTGPRSRNE